MISLPAPEGPPDDSQPKTASGAVALKRGTNKGKKYLTANAIFAAAITEEEVVLIARKLVEMSLAGNIKAIKLLLDRKLGKLVQPIEHNTTGRVVLVLPDNGRLTNNGGHAEN